MDARWHLRLESEESDGSSADEGDERGAVSEVTGRSRGGSSRGGSSDDGREGSGDGVGASGGGGSGGAG